MTTARKYLFTVAITIVALTWFAVDVRSSEEEGGPEISVKIAESPDGDERVAGEFSRREQLKDEYDRISPETRREAYEQVKTMSLLYLPEAWAEFAQYPDVPRPWVPIGPGNVGGRIRSIIIHPGNPSIMWVGAVSGGVWKTTNGGDSWTTDTDFLSTLGVNCMVIDPANPNILYAGTGEGFFNNDAVPGDGIFKTTDGGANWFQLPNTKTISENDDFAYVNRLAISPTNSQLLLAATRSGKILRSTNAGGNWSQQLVTTPMVDVRFRPPNENPNNPQTAITCVAASRNGYVFYSSDDGQTWETATGLPGPHEADHRIEVAYSRSSPSIVYASAAANGHLYKSINGGSSFTDVGAPPDGTSASWYNNSLWVDPTNPNIVLVGSKDLWRTTQGGAAGSWTGISYFGVHPDHHAFVEHPGYNGVVGGNNTVYDGSDGGMSRIDNVLDPTVTWTSLNHNLAITQFYGGAGHVATGKIIGGTQDNGTVRYQSDPQDWTSKYAGDGGFCAVDQTANPYFYGEYVNLQIYRSTDGGDTAYPIWDGIPHPPECGNVPCADFTAPFILDPNNENRMLAGGTSLWRSNDVRNISTKPIWSEIKSPIIPNSRISAIAVAPGQSNIIWVGYKNGFVYYTTNGTAAAPTWTQVNNNLPARECTRIAIGPGPTGDPEVALPKYVTFSGPFPSAGDSRGNVWKTTDNGQTWSDISGSAGNVPRRLPRATVHSLVVSPSNPNTLYVGTDVGIFATSNGGVTWSAGAPGVGQPANVRVDELFWMGTKLVAATHGRGMFTIGH